MEHLLKSLSQYEILNNLIPGMALCLLLKYTVHIDFFIGNNIENVFIVYLIGIVNGRIGSIIIEPILKKTGFVIFVDYSEYHKVEDEKLKMLNQINNGFRSMLSVSVVTLIAYIGRYFCSICEWVQNGIVLLIK